MSNIRAARKRQQLNNLVAMVTDLARPGYTVVDFCSGTVCVCSSISDAMHVYLLSLHLTMAASHRCSVSIWQEGTSSLSLPGFAVVVGQCALHGERVNTLVGKGSTNHKLCQPRL